VLHAVLWEGNVDHHGLKIERRILKVKGEGKKV
jgi:hypothetical protein